MGNAFSKLGISNGLETILNNNGITEPTPIQEKSIPDIVKGRDVIAQAQTGTGKTLAFLLPMMDKIDSNKEFLQGLIITPTRELAIQITQVAKMLAPARNIQILAAYGGQDVEQQVHKLKKGIHLVIATPGRLLDHIRRENIEVGRIRVIVLDEADEMLNMGFMEDIESIVNRTPKARQTMLFSATISNEIRKLGTRFMRDPLQIEIEGKNVTLDEIKQEIVETSEKGKLDTLCKLIDDFNPYLAIVFCRTKHKVSEVNLALLQKGYNSDELHGDLTQGKRERVMKDFRTAKLQILVATDIAARGIDVEGITHVINYDIPEDVDSYIHRIGRTGRIGHLGMAVTLVTPRDQDNLAMIDRKIKANFKSQKTEIKSRRRPERSSDGKSEGRTDRKSSTRVEKKVEKKTNIEDIPKKYRPKKAKEDSKSAPNDNRHKFKKR